MDPCGIIIFGASGDLTMRKLIPAFFHLYESTLLPEHFYILGTGRTALNDQDFRDTLKTSLAQEDSLSGTEADDTGSTIQERMNDFLKNCHYLPMDPRKEDEYGTLKKRIAELEKSLAGGGTPLNRLFYLSTPPNLYSLIPRYLKTSGLTDESTGWKRLVVEKPFGSDKISALELDKALHEQFSEQQIYRIDHYLGKETVQNLLVFRFANGLFEPMWNSNFVDYVEITAAESLGVEKRGGYYEGSGAVRDMLQNHLLQVLALTAMEPPARIAAGEIRDEAAKVLRSLKPLDENDLRSSLVMGQYTASHIGGTAVPGYRDEQGVDPQSRTETFVALKLHIQNWRWNGVPFYLRTGKRLPTRVTEVVIHFKSTPHPEFTRKAPANTLIIRIQPDEGIRMNFILKEPGAGFKTRDVSMNFFYDELPETRVLSAYERLLLDALRGDATLFARSDAVHACWNFVQPILDFKEDPRSLFGYAAGTWGPRESDVLLERDGRSWRHPCKNLTSESYCEL